MTREHAVQLLSEYILRERRPTRKGEVAGAYIEVIEALRVLAGIPCPACVDLRREIHELREGRS